MTGMCGPDIKPIFFVLDDISSPRSYQVEQHAQLANQFTGGDIAEIRMSLSRPPEFLIAGYAEWERKK